MSTTEQHFKAGESHGQGQATAEEWMQSTKDAANATKDKTADATQSATESAQHGKDKSASFIQQKGEQMKHMAQGAVDSVKSTLGVGDK
ncbi:late embryogenesis abundant protein 1-like isoform X1 [Juglans regia]|uniref:Late embryogenesis abundant protein 1-like isoform X1 n=2 Tax=Juglans regia TaxID=51240 RepID=A0A2I4DKC7_JUGRE|nr:late embryogenesis abundant protein 1-like isoform X1 [Juglans regia]